MWGRSSHLVIVRACLSAASGSFLIICVTTFPGRFPACFQRVGDAHEVEQFTGDEIGYVVDGGGQEVKAGVGGGENSAGIAEDLVVIQIDWRQRHLTMAEHELAPFLERYGSRPG